MSCSTMLDQILEADLDVLDGTRDPDLARHVRECARCGAVARQIVGDTRMLAVAVASPRTTIEVVTRAVPVRRSRATAYRTAIVVAGLAAVLAVVVIGTQGRRVTAPADPSQAASVLPPAMVVASIPAVLPTVRQALVRSRSGETRGSQPALDRSLPRVLATVAERTVAKPVGLPSAVAPVRLDTVAAISLGGAVAVDPPAGMRANIIRTSNPTVTVVWLYH